MTSASACVRSAALICSLASLSVFTAAFWRLHSDGSSQFFWAPLLLNVGARASTRSRLNASSRTASTRSTNAWIDGELLDARVVVRQIAGVAHRVELGDAVIKHS